VPRRVHVPKLSLGAFELPPAQAHHLRDVLRQKAGDRVEIFDDDGAAAEGLIMLATPAKLVVQIDLIDSAKGAASFAWSVAAAIPKGARADWMIEKLAELGTRSFFPLITSRGIAMPAGEEKFRRWARLAAQAARQSGQRDVMHIEPAATLTEILKSASTVWFFSTDSDAKPIAPMLSQPPPRDLLLLIGPEGGWTDAEIELLRAGSSTAVNLGPPILRIETAAIAASAIVASAWNLTGPGA
jgi:16S rRNA (uracil1498-N3)-methyltransferase